MDSKNEPSMGEILTSLRRIVPAQRNDNNHTPWRLDTDATAQTRAATQKQSAGLQSNEAEQRTEAFQPHRTAHQLSSLVNRSEDGHERENNLGDVLYTILRKLERISEKLGIADEHNPVAPPDVQLPDSRFQHDREQMTKELTTQVGKITEAISQQGRSVTIALGAGDRQVVGALEKMTGSLIGALDDARGAVTKDLARVDAHLSQMNKNMQSVLARPREAVANAEAAPSQAKTARQTSLRTSPQIAEDHAPPPGINPAVSTSATDGPGARPPASESDHAEGGSVDRHAGHSSFDSIRERLEVIDKLWTEDKSLPYRGLRRAGDR